VCFLSGGTKDDIFTCVMSNFPAVSWFRRFSYRPVYVGFVVGKVTVREVFLWILPFSRSVSFRQCSTIIQPSSTLYKLSNGQRHYIRTHTPTLCCLSDSALVLPGAYVCMRMRIPYGGSISVQRVLPNDQRLE
jgi:hypothetical protein